MRKYVQCAGSCALPIRLTFQERREKTPLINVTCENPACTACGYTVTLIDESELLTEYPKRLQEKIETDSEWIKRCKG